MNKTILITGASSGIGKATAKLFQQKGWNVIATMRAPENETEFILLENVLLIKLDVLDIVSIKNAVEKGITKFGKIDVVLNNAGYGMLGTFESATREQVLRQYGVNVFGLMDVTRTILPHFRSNKAGLFINISSIAGKAVYPLSSLYHSTKFAVEGFSESLQYELSSIGAGVKIIEPGAVLTDYAGRSLVLHDNASMKEYATFVEHLLIAYRQMIQSGTMSSPELVAEVIYTAATDETTNLRYIAGADAGHILAARKELTDDEFMEKIKNSLGLQTGNQFLKQ